MITALVPVKDLRQAKQRLASLLSPEERRTLCLVMLEDVLSALAAARRLDNVLVYSPDEDVLAAARKYGMEAVRERVATGQSAAVSQAIPLCVARGATSVVTIPVDTPLLKGKDIDSLVDFARSAGLPSPSAVMVPSADGTGTNALLLTPPDALLPRFGPNSFSLHIREAVERGAAYRRFDLPRLALDIDSPDDVAAFLRQAERSPAETRTIAHLASSGIVARCAARP